MSQAKIVRNCFAPIPKENLGPQKDPLPYDKTNKIYNLIPVAKKVIDEDGIEKSIIEFEPTFIREVDIQEVINSYSDEVGIQNILKKLALTGDRSLLNQTGREPLCPDGGLEPVQDYSNVPSSKAEAFNIVRAGVYAYDNLPDDIKQKMSFSQFAEEFGQADFNAYVESIKAKYAAEASVAEGESK